MMNFLLILEKPAFCLYQKVLILLKLYSIFYIYYLYTKNLNKKQQNCDG